MALSAKHAKFVAEYLKDLNATQACIRAGYSKKTAKQQGSRLLTNAAVRAAVDAKGEKLLEKADVTSERIVGEFARYAFAPKLDDFSGRPIGDGYPEVEPRDRLKALESLGKIKGLFVEKVQHDVGPGLAELISASLAKGAA